MTNPQTELPDLLERLIRDFKMDKTHRQIIINCFRWMYEDELTKAADTAREERDEKFNLDELSKPWVDTFYDSDWQPDDLNYTEFEKMFIEELSWFLPRHMEVYDWNLPYADMIVLILRNLSSGKKIITEKALQQDTKE